MSETEDQNDRMHMRRAEWIALGALLINVFTLVFAGGAFWQMQMDLARRIFNVEASIAARDTVMMDISIRLERIDTTTQMLKEGIAENGTNGGGR